MSFQAIRHLVLTSALVALAPLAALATDVSQQPLIVAAPETVKANIFYVLDDSGSMNFDFLPDHINGGGGTDPALCRSSGATSTNSGNFGNVCCIGGNISNACWQGNAPFGSLRGQPPFLTAGFNGMAYDPKLTYKPPLKADGTTWPSQTRSATTAWTVVKNDAYGVQNTGTINLTTQFPDTEYCTDNTWTDCLRNDNYVLPGTVNGKSYTTFHAVVATGAGSVATGAPDAATVAARTFGPHYYSIQPGEYCTDNTLRDCRGTAGGSYSVPSLVRWCKSDADSRATQPPVANCQAAKTSTFYYARYPTKFFSAATNEVRATATFSIAANSSCAIQLSQVSVSGINLLNANTASNSAASSIASAINTQINAKTATTGYSSTVSGARVTITAPSGRNTTATLSFTFAPANCGLNLSNAAPAFSGYAAATSSSFPGSFSRTDIVPTVTSYPKASTRIDCTSVANACSYDEEMTNFANWWTYYHSRMQMMKSAASSAFSAIGSNRRVGYMSINNTTGRDFLNISDFDTTQKTNWFAKFTAARPGGSTPLRVALSTAGRLYAGKLNGTSLNGSTVVDPIQYSCQKNFTILSTDGFWNETSTPIKPDGSAIGDQDSALDRPMYDGNATANTLADVAAYYRLNDLRTGTTGTAACMSNGTGADVCGNNDPANSMQIMTTFTLGLGASGFMQFSPSYLTDTSGDFRSVAVGAAANPSVGVCNWQTSGSCNWPTPVSNTLTAIDDLWHAAVNGGGTYFSATNPASLETGLVSALTSLNQKIGAAAAATTSNPNVSAGQNQVFVTNFKTGEWSGELKSQRIDINTGQVGSAADWSAQTQLDGNNSRTIYMFSSGASNLLKAFDWASMTATEKAYFQQTWVTTSGRSLSQFCTIGTFCLSATDQATAAGQPLVNYLRGDRSNEGDLTDPSKYFRARGHLLGDIVNSEAVYVANSLVNLRDTGYDTFKATLATRTSMVYVGSNDGMLHAFRADTGDETWAYVPTAVLPNLYKLADKQYSSQHQYFVDGTPVVQDAYIGGAWKSVLVSGLGAGGRSYFALDVTDPANPKALWEFSDNNLGLTLGRPEIGKLSNGTWVAIFGSGYNNTTPGDGVGRLYVVNLATGALIRTISTGVGSTGTPSGLAHVRAWVENSDIDTTFVRVYGGDELGNLWRFDVNGAGSTAQRIATLRDASGNAQPITSRPELGQVGNYAMVYVGTGRYLGQTDLNDSSQQSIYGIKDTLGTTDIGNPRLAANSFVQQTLTVGTCPTGSAACSAGAVVRTNGTPLAVNLDVNGGWFVDLPQSRERVNTDPQLALGTLVVNSNVIDSSNVCSVGGSSWANFFDYRTGAPVSTAKNVSSVSLGNAIATRPALVQLPSNKVISITRLSDDRTVSTPTPTPNTTGVTRRLSWRDLIQQ